MGESRMTVSENPRQPLYPNRLVNFVGKLRKARPADPTELMERASADTGLRDFGGEDFLPALDVCCRALNDDARMSPMGRLLSRRSNIKLLTDRLHIQQTVERDPEIRRQEITAPILIFGNPRSGTTLLQRMLAEDPRFRVMLGWEAFCATSPPHPDTSTDDPGIAEAKRLFDLIDKSSPAIFTIHPMAPMLPEECWYLLERQFIRPLMAQYWEVPEYWEWLQARSDEDLERDLRHYRLQLQMLQRHFHEPRWLLKSPVHALFLVPFARTFPDMHFVECHRDPCHAVASLASLVAGRKAAYYTSVNLEAVGRKALALFHVGLQRILSARRRLPADRFSDVSFSSLMSDPLGTVEELYAGLGLALAEEVRERMAAFVVSQRAGRHRGHRYTLEEFGLDAAVVRDQTQEYPEALREMW